MSLDPNISRCGLDCTLCEKYQECGGCNTNNGAVWWTQFTGEKCPICRCCADENGFDHCGLCNKLPCEHFYQVRDPRMTDEEHEAGVKDCVKRLQNLVVR